MEITGRTQGTLLCCFSEGFFANMVEKEGKRVYVKGHWIDFEKERINMLLKV